MELVRRAVEGGDRDDGERDGKRALAPGAAPGPEGDRGGEDAVGDEMRYLVRAEHTLGERHARLRGEDEYRYGDEGRGKFTHEIRKVHERTTFSRIFAEPDYYSGVELGFDISSAIYDAYNGNR